MPTWLRLGMLYAAMNLGFGIASPFASVWFAAHGLDGRAIGLVLAAPMLGRAVTGPAIAVFAEGFRSERTGLALIALGAAVAYAVLPLFHGLPAWTLLWLAAASLIGALIPLTDALTLGAARAEGFAYGRPRALGSAAFIVGVVGGGALVQHAGAEAIMPALALSAAACALLARIALRPSPGAHLELKSALARWARVGRLVRDPTFMLAITSAGLINAAHAFYYSFSTLTWRRQGIDPGTTGLLWGLGVAVEVAFLWFGEPWRRRVGPERLLVLGGAAAVVRWSAYACSPPVWLLAPLQALHVLTFAATFVVSLQLAEKFSPPEAAASAQALNNALSSGVLIGAATLGSGVLFDAVGAGGYWLMAGVAGVGLAGALWLQARSAAVARGGPTC